MSVPQSEVLIVHTGGGIGDVLLSTPVIQAFHQAGFQVDYLCRASTASALQSNPQIRELFQWPGRGPGGMGALLQWVRRLRKRRYTHAVVLWSTTATAWLTWLCGIPHRVGQDSRWSYSFLFNHRVRVRSEYGDCHSHWSEILLDYARAVGLEPGPPQVLLPISADSHRQVDRLLENLAGEGPLIGLHAFKGPPVVLERWPLEVFAGWVRVLHDQLGARIVLTGSPAERPWADRILALAQIERAWNLAGQTDLGGLAALAQRCEVFVCPDSGPMHVAAAAGATVLGIYAMEEDFPQRWAPLSPRARILRPQPTGCPPGCRKPTCRDYRCYRSVGPQQLVQEVRSLLGVPS